MSSKAMAHVWCFSERKGDELLVLLALSDSANDNGETMASIDRIARKARLSITEASVIINQLASEGELILNDKTIKIVMRGGYL